MATYKVLVGLDYGNKRMEEGDLVSDLPAKSISWLVEQNIVEVIEANEPKTSNKKPSKVETVEEESE